MARLNLSGIVHFNSRTPRGVRHYRQILIRWINVISTHAPHAECDQNAANFDNNGNISTHAPHAECDLSGHLRVILLNLFQLTHPTRSATILQHIRTTGMVISTHAPHAECDGVIPTRPAAYNTFQLTHPTRSATLVLRQAANEDTKFQLTHPTRSATWVWTTMEITDTLFQLTHPTRSATERKFGF